MRSDLISAFRSLRADPAFTFLVVAILGLGIGANTAIFSVLQAVLLRPLDYPAPQRLYKVAGITAGGKTTQIVPGAYELIRERSNTLETSALMRTRPVTIEGKEGAESVFGQALAGDGLRVFGTPPLMGRLFHSGAAKEVVLSHRIWLRRYNGEPATVGGSIILNGESFTVAGIMPPGFATTHAAYDLWLPWTFTAAELAHRGAGGFPMIVRRHASASHEQLQAEITLVGQVFESDLPSDLKGWRTTVTELKESRVGSHSQALWVLLGAVGFVLLIACLNVASLTMSRALDRTREVALRLALGAPRWRVMRQLVVESLLLSAAGGATGLLLAWWGTRSIVALSTSGPILPRLDQASLDHSVLLFNVAVTLLTAVAFGVAPAWNASRVGVQEALKQSGRSFAGDRTTHLFRGATVAIQVTLSLILLSGAGLLLRSFVNLIETDPGFRAEGVLTARVPSTPATGANPAAPYTEILERARAIPGVQTAALSTILPMGPIQSTISFAVEDGPTTARQLPAAQYRAVSPDYFRAMGIPVLQGRPFNNGDQQSTAGVAIINDLLATRHWPGEDALGKRIATEFEDGAAWLTVVGVVRGVRQSNLKTEPQQELYRPYTQHFHVAQGATVVLRAADPDALVEPFRRLLRDHFPAQPLAEIRTMEQFVERSVARPRFDMTLLSLFAAIALAVAAVGVYGLMSYGVRRRRREIGVRLAIGATPRQVSQTVLRQGVALMAPGLLLGVAGSLALTRLLASRLYQVQPNDPTTLAAACALLFAIGLLSCWAPARRAAGVNPTETLRHD